VKRKVYPEVPPRVEYSLTAKGLEIQPVMMSLKALGEEWLHQEPCHCPMDPNMLLGTASSPGWKPEANITRPLGHAVN
jgi:hypothetical protein